MPCPNLTIISEEECIGDSLQTINNNFLALSAGLCNVENTGGGGTDDNLPIGTIMYFSASTAPVGWFECDGRLLNKTTYADLFAIVGTTYGESGAAFRIPDLRGEFVRGWDNGRGVDSGRAFGSFQRGTIVPVDTTGVNATYTYSVAWNSNTGTSSYNIASQAQAVDMISDYNGTGLPTDIQAQAFAPNSSVTWLNANFGSWGTGSSFYPGMARPRNVALLPCIKYAQTSSLNVLGLSAQQIIDGIGDHPGVAKAWVNFDGTFASSPFTVVNGGIREAYNITSVTDLGIGRYQVNTTFSSTANKSIIATCKQNQLRPSGRPYDANVLLFNIDFDGTVLPAASFGLSVTGDPGGSGTTYVNAFDVNVVIFGN